MGSEGNPYAGVGSLRDIGAGDNIDDIMEWFDALDHEQIKAVIEFADRSLDKPAEHSPAH